MLKPLARERTKTTAIARKLKRSVGDAIGALLVFLHLLERNAEGVAEVGLAHVTHQPTHSDGRTKFEHFRFPSPVQRAGSGSGSPILLFDRHHPSVPICAKPVPSRTAAHWTCRELIFPVPLPALSTGCRKRNWETHQMRWLKAHQST
jgi:hypothetical protein